MLWTAKFPIPQIIPEGIGIMISQNSKDGITPRIYVACLSSYNNGILHGEWIDVETEEQVYEEIRAILKSSPMQGKDTVEEWAIHDCEEFGFSLSEYEGIPQVVEYAEIIQKYGVVGQLALGHTSDADEAKSLLENYIGEYESLKDYAYQYSEDCMEIPESLEPYIDYDALARDLSFDLVVLEEAYNAVHLFHAY